MLNNLRAEMARHGISAVDIAKAINKTDKSARDRINGKRGFTIPEAEAIRDEFFPGMSLEYLFARTTNHHSA